MTELSTLTYKSYQLSTKTVTFTGAAGFGANGTNTVFFTVTGLVYIRYIYGYCIATLTQDLATPTLSLGVVGALTAFIPATNPATNISIGRYWVSATPGNAALAIPGICMTQVAAANIVANVAGTNNINGGTLAIGVWWMPASIGGYLI